MVRAVAWRQDGRLLASADESGMIKVWARASDTGIAKPQTLSIGDGMWRCKQTILIQDPDGDSIPVYALGFGVGSSRSLLFAGSSAPQSPAESSLEIHSF